ncbi:DNA methyltransferase [uncultured Thiocystis sp.]|jgi:type II restriction/modification system DNA methylase subunit YeeA|uniref:class I SAM-dependent DNA methyltransferase n=1 Tax=uncultured Thiocystis sp. TaxID=1202134 RepID=UPI0025CFAC32|nr:DNA methyltransferase [uncultured Thiocystis sp.]
MTPEQFVAKWTGVTLKERSAAQEHFIDLCRLLDEPTPAEADPTGAWYCFEKGAKKAGGGDGWADVWKRACYGMEYKGPGKDLQKAFQQLQLYTPALEYPPLLIVSDIARIVIHTAFTGTVPEIHQINLEDLLDPAQRRLLKWAFSDPERLRPGRTTAHLTEAAAGRFGDLAQVLRERGHAPSQVAHFSQQILFCLFAEDIDLLPNKLFSKLLEAGQKRPDDLPAMLQDLFGAMATGGRIGFEAIDWFNGGLFASPAALPLAPEDIQRLRALADLDWSAIDPTIFGTLFERGLDPEKRSQLGAHYTDPGSIMRLVDPVVLDPLRDAWATQHAAIAALMAKAGAAKSPSVRTKAVNEAHAVLQGFLDRLARFRVLDPACGSGNFLLLALLGLKDLEHRVILEAETLGLPRSFPRVGPENVLGLELNPYAAELARVTVWIGEIQWMLNHGFSLSKNPILKPLDTIRQQDAIVNADGTEPAWPEADVIVGNPPFLGNKKMVGALGEDYAVRLRKRYQGRVPGDADLVTYWFEKARVQIETGKARLAGLVATNSIRGGPNRKVLARITDTGAIFDAWSDEPWINDGAAVRVSLLSFATKDHGRSVQLNGAPVAGIFADLTAAETLETGVDITQSRRLSQNAGVAYMATTKGGAFDIAGEAARAMLSAPNPHCRPNADVVKPWVNGLDVTRRPRDMWIIDFGPEMDEAAAALYEQPFAHLVSNVKTLRQENRREAYARYWWRFVEPRPAMRAKLAGLERYIATPTVAKHRLFLWLHPATCSDHQLIVTAKSDDTTFGILHSRFHELWSLRMGTSLEDRPRYTPTTTFETFPFPEGLTPADTIGATETLDSGAVIPSVAPAHRLQAQAIADAAHRLNALRENWLNPPEWIERIPEVVPGYPERIVPKPEHAAALKKRTPTNLYNTRPTWLEHAHQALDAAVATSYGWEDYSPAMPEAEILRRLLALNLERSTKAE